MDGTHAGLLEVLPGCPEGSLERELVEQVALVGVVVGHRLDDDLAEPRIVETVRAPRDEELLVLRSQHGVDREVAVGVEVTPLRGFLDDERPEPATRDRGTERVYPGPGARRHGGEVGDLELREEALAGLGQLRRLTLELCPRRQPAALPKPLYRKYSPYPVWLS